MAGTSNSITTHNVLSGVLNADNVISGLVNTAFNPAYALVTQAGAQIVLFINSNDYKMYAQLKDKNGNLIYTSNIIDLPLETMVVDGRYDSNTKKLILVLDNGNEIEVPLEALINGLVNEDDLIANYYDKDEIDALLNGYWTKIELTQEDIDNWNAKQEYLNQGDGIEISADTILKGNTSQESTTGKNLMPNNATTQTIKGITFTINEDKSITLNGTNDNTGASTLFLITEVDNFSLNAGTYNSIATGIAGVNIGAYDGTNYYTFAGGTGNSITLQNNTSFASVYLQVSKGNSTTFNNKKIYPILSLTPVSESDYEPYTNGPAPNPDYPYPVNVVTGDNEVKFEGKNLLQKQGYGTPNTDSDYWEGNPTFLTSGDDGWGTFAFDNSSGSSVAYKNMMIKNGNVNYKPSTNYTIFVELKDVSKDSATGDMIFLSQGANTRDPFNSGEKKITYNEATNKVYRFSATTKADLTNTYAFRTFVVIPVGKNVSFKVRTMIVEGTYTSDTYIPYQSQTYPINLGSMELCKIGDYQDYIAKSTGKNLIDVPDVTLSGANYVFNLSNLTFPIGTYTLNMKQPYNLLSVAVVDKDGNEYFNTTKTIPLTIEATNGIKGLRVYSSSASGGTFSQIMLNEGSTALPYEPYGKVWYKYGAIGKVVLDGSEDWYISGNDTNTQRYATNVTTYGVMSASNGYCNNNRYVSSGVSMDEQLCGISSGIYYYRLNQGILSEYSATKFKEWVANNNIINYIPLTTPTITPITDTTLIEQLDNLSIGFSNNWVKNISQTNADLPFEIEYDNTNLTISASSNLVRNTDYATSQTGGVIKVGNAGTNINNNGYIHAGTLNYTQYNSADNSTFVGKGTLENVITGKELTNKTYVDAADAVFESELFDDGIISVEDVTEANINNTMNKSQLKIDLKGNTSQDSTTGANLQKFSPRTSSGTYNYVCDDKGQVTITGTVSSTVGLSYNLTDNYMSLTAGTYKVKVIGKATNVRFQTNNAYAIIGNFNDNQEATLTVTQDVSNFQIFQYPTINTTLNENYYITLASGNTATTERYTGGNPAPNPDYPMPVNVVTGDNEVKVEGKNLIPFTNQDFTVNNVRYYVQNGSLYINGTSTGETSSKNQNFENNFSFTLPSGTYTISQNSTVGLYLFDSEGNNILSNPSYVASGTTRTIILENQMQLFFGFYVYQKSFANINAEVMIEKSSTATEYEEHKEQTYPINLGSMELCKIGDYQDYIRKSTGKNLFDKSSFTYIDKKRLDDNGNVVTDNDSSYSTSLIAVKPNTTYTIQGTQGITGKTTRIYYYNSSKTFMSRSTNHATDSYSFETPSNCYYIALQLRNSTYINTSIIMINEGTTALPYEPYGKVWYKHKEIESYTMTNNSITSISTYWYDSKGQYGAALPKSFLNLPNTSEDKGSLCSVSKKVNGQTYITKNTYIYNANNNYVFFFSDEFDTTEHANAKLVGAKLYYNITPTNEPITDTTLIEQLDNLEKAYSYDTQTNISQTNQDKPFILDINAIADNVNGLKLENENQEYKTNKVIELSSNSTDDEYPSAKCVYDIVGNIEAVLAAMDSGSGV